MLLLSLCITKSPLSRITEGSFNQLHKTVPENASEM